MSEDEQGIEPIDLGQCEAIAFASNQQGSHPCIDAMALGYNADRSHSHATAIVIVGRRMMTGFFVPA